MTLSTVEIIRNYNIFFVKIREESAELYVNDGK